MKKLLYIIIVLSFLVWGKCASSADEKLPGLVQSGKYQQNSMNGIKQLQQPKQTLDSIYRIGEYRLYPSDLPQGKGRESVQIYCRFCHSTTYITMQPTFSATIWEKEVNKMITTYGAPIPENIAKQILTYLQNYFTPATRK